MAVTKADGPDATAREQLEDPFLTALIKLVLVSHRSTSRLKTRVETHEGNVTLTGSVSNQAEKDLITKCVQDICGVRTAKNHMTIEGVASHSISAK